MALDARGVPNCIAFHAAPKERLPGCRISRHLRRAAVRELSGSISAERDLVEVCERRQGFAPSVQRQASGDVVVDQHRTSSSCPMLWPLMTPQDSWLMPKERQRWRALLVDMLKSLPAQVIGVDENRIEPLQLVKYQPGQCAAPDACKMIPNRSGFIFEVEI
eukprot:Skav210311  [mRNA]  locus=scaffold475:236281:240167:- [translate_table: standard]